MKAIDWRSVNLPPFKKNFYDPSPEVTHRSRADVESFRTSKEITIIQVRESSKQLNNNDNVGKNCLPKRFKPLPNTIARLGLIN